MENHGRTSGVCCSCHRRLKRQAAAAHRRTLPLRALQRDMPLHRLNQRPRNRQAQTAAGVLHLDLHLLAVRLRRERAAAAGRRAALLARSQRSQTDDTMRAVATQRIIDLKNT
jgi:hypothetical protein